VDTSRKIIFEARQEKFSGRFVLLSVSIFLPSRDLKLKVSPSQVFFQDSVKKDFHAHQG
jgi:hypothetical protein